MIWYLLYPLRGTTEVPDLAPDHPIRDLATKYGRHAARHVVTTLLISIAVAVILLYPIPFLFTGTSFINGASILPHHVWTSAQPLPCKSQTEPDIIMRSIWVHGSYMQALDPAILSDALEIQDELLGSTKDFDPRGASSHASTFGGHSADEMTAQQRDALHVVNGLSNQSWFFHSPLQYWGSSRDRVLADNDLLTTINDNKNLSTSAGMTLRHSIVFSGKRFEERRLVAADALVITLCYLKDSPVGRQWARKALTLPDKVGEKWDIYPRNADIQSSRLYEYHFLPISLGDSISLALAYGLTFGYFLIGLSKLRAIKSKIGLMVAVAAQIAFSVLSSFTVCAVLNIDLSRIPRAAYPLTILSMSLENVFRLINAVILTQPEDIISNRIGQALGETAPTAAASLIQNVAILLILSRWVSQGVSAFCIFAAVAVVFDFFYRSTFFLSVLSVDVRRLELSDALDKVARQQARHAKLNGTQNKEWLNRVLQGRMALSTRIAGTVVTLGFVLIAQWHVFDAEPALRTVSRLWRGNNSVGPQPNGMPSPLKDLHQARSPTSWLRLQDHETAQEVINIIRPSFHSYVARIYEPLIFVLKDSDRNPPSQEPSLLPAAYDFVHHHMFRFVATVVMTVAAVRLLMSFLLWEEEEMDDASSSSEGLGAGSMLSVQHLNGGHALDIAMLCPSAEGHVVTVGLDRLLRVWDVRSGASSYIVADGRGPARWLFPIIALAIDSRSHWLAILSPSRICYWSLKRREWGESVEVASLDRRSECFFVESRGEKLPPRSFIVWRDGTMTEVPSVQQGLSSSNRLISPHGLACARVQASAGDDANSEGRPFVIVASRSGHINYITREDGGWQDRTLISPVTSDQKSDVQSLTVEGSLEVVLATYTGSADLISLQTGQVLHSFPLEGMQPRSLRCTMIRPRAGRGTANHAVSLVVLTYTERTTGACIIDSYTPADGRRAIALGVQDSSAEDGTCTWEETQRVSKRIEDPGRWEVLCDGTVVGIRQRGSAGRSARCDSGGLRKRFPRVHESAKGGDAKFWEVWTSSPGSKSEMDDARPLLKPDEGAGHLLITEVGPSVEVGLTSAAFGFGNVVKIVTRGGHLVFEGTAGASKGQRPNASRRRKSGGTQGRLCSQDVVTSG